MKNVWASEIHSFKGVIVETNIVRTLVEGDFFIFGAEIYMKWGVEPDTNSLGGGGNIQISCVLGYKTFQFNDGAF